MDSTEIDSTGVGRVEVGSADVGSRAQVVATVVRGGVVESVHHGHVVALDGDGGLVAALGDPGAVVFARSSLKPLQAVAMLRSASLSTARCWPWPARATTASSSTWTG